MPLKLVPPKPGKTPNWYIRGTYLGQYVEETTRTPVEALARKLLAARKAEIERGGLSPRVKEGEPSITFEFAAGAYIEGGGDDRFFGKHDPNADVWHGGLIAILGQKPIADITQQDIDRAAVTLYPDAGAPTRNRQVYTPVSAVLKHAGIEMKLRRPKGWRGSARVDWLQPEQAFRIFAAADRKDAEFGAFLRLLCYTGMRLGEALALTCDKMMLHEAFAYVTQTKNDDPRGVHLPPVVVAALANHPRGLERGKKKVFRFRKCGRLYTWLAEVKAEAGADVAFCSFHTFRHTWATWMRRYAGLDTRGLVGTGAWRDPKSAARYEHVVVSEESRKADLLPTPPRGRKAKSGENPGSGVKSRRKSL